jgi:hypothetical protein
VGAGPGPVEKYKIDAPFPWGDNTEIAVPMQQMVDDAWQAISPKIDALEAKLIQDMEGEMEIYAPVLVKQVMDEVVRPEIAKQMEVAFAEVGLVKDDAIKGMLALTGMVVLSVGIAAWWVKKG